MAGGSLFKLFIAIIILILLPGCSSKEPNGNSVAPLTEDSHDDLITEEKLKIINSSTNGSPNG